MKTTKIIGLIAAGAVASIIPYASTNMHSINKTLLTQHSSQVSNTKGSTVTKAQIFTMKLPVSNFNNSDEGFAATFDSNGFASPINEKLYNYENQSSNQKAAMAEAVELHDGNWNNTCVLFQSSCLRAIGIPVPDSMAWTTNLANWLINNEGWIKHTNFNNIQKGDLVFASWEHTFLFMGWKNKAEGIAYVMGDEAFVNGSQYSNRYMNGTTPSQNPYSDNQFAATYFLSAQGNDNNVNNKLPTENWNPEDIAQCYIPNGANLMSEPNSNSQILFQIGAGNNVGIIGQKGSWYKIYIAGYTGWVNASEISQYESLPYTSTDAPLHGSQPAVIGKNGHEIGNSSNSNQSLGSPIGTLSITSPVGLWMNSGPSKDAINLEVIPYNTNLKVYSQKRGWYEVQYDGQIGWVDGQYVNFSGSPTTQGSSSLTNSNTNSKSLTSKSIDSTVEVIADGLYMNKYPIPNDHIIACLNKGTKVHAIAESSNGWFKVEYDGQTGWIGGSPYSKIISNATPQNNIKTQSHQNNIKTQNSPIGKLSIASPIGLWMNSQPNTISTNLEVIPYNTQLTVYGQKNGWYEVQYNGQTGWVDGEYVIFSKNSNNNKTNNHSNNNKNSTSKSINATVEVTADGLYMNKYPIPNDHIITCLNKGTKVHAIAESSNGWFKIEYNGQTGWIGGSPYSKIISNNTPESQKSKVTPTTKTLKNETGYLITNSPFGLWLHTAPNANSGEITVIPYKVKLHFNTEKSGWYQVTYNGQNGWIDGNKTRNITVETNPQVTQTTTITSPVGLWMNLGPGRYTGQVSLIPYNTTLTVVAQDNGWYEVQYDGSIGWIDGEYTSGLSNQSSMGKTIQSSNETLTVNSPVGLWMNVGPSPSTSQIMCLGYGAQGTILGESNGWYKINYSGTIGWVDGAYVTLN